jgi:N-acetylmuramoyl-L-alanine amidase
MAFNDKFTITPMYIPKPSRRRSGILTQKIRFLVAHDTGNPGSTAADNVRFYIDTCQTVPRDKTASAHIFVDDKQILECIPALTGTSEKAWHVLYSKPKDNQLYGANANDAAIGVEYCYGPGIDADKAYAKYIWVMAKLCDVFGLDPVKDITGHFFLDPERKTDPVTGLARSRRTYEQLLRDIVSEYKACRGEEVPLEPEALLTEGEGQRLTTVKLNLRISPDTLGAVVEVIPADKLLTYQAKKIDGQAVNNNATWYRDNNGHWFWEGGTREPD